MKKTFYFFEKEKLHFPNYFVVSDDSFLYHVRLHQTKVQSAFFLLWFFWFYNFFYQNYDQHHLPPLFFWAWDQLKSLLMTQGRVKMVLDNPFATAFSGNRRGYVRNKPGHSSEHKATNSTSIWTSLEPKPDSPTLLTGQNLTLTLLTVKQTDCGQLCVCRTTSSRGSSGPSIRRDSKCYSHHPVGTPSCTDVRQDKE